MTGKERKSRICKEALEEIKVIKPVIHIDLNSESGNAFFVLAIAKKALIKLGKKDEAEEYITRATAGDYQNLLKVTREYCELVEL